MFYYIRFQYVFNKKLHIHSMYEFTFFKRVNLINFLLNIQLKRIKFYMCIYVHSEQTNFPDSKPIIFLSIKVKLIGILYIPSLNKFNILVIQKISVYFELLNFCFYVSQLISNIEYLLFYTDTKYKIIRGSCKSFYYLQR